MKRFKRTMCAVLALFTVSAGANAEEEFRWPQLTINVGSTPGGGFDSYARLLANHIGRHLPGNPAVVVQNRPGAGGLLMFNYLYNVAPQDGTELGVSAPLLMLHPQLYGEQSDAQFDPEGFNAIGSMARSFSVFLRNNDVDLTLEDVLGGEPFTVGSPGPGGGPENFARAIIRYLDADATIVGGYPGVAEVQWAFQQGEVDVMAGFSWENYPFLPGGGTPLIQYRHERHADLPDVPTIMELVDDPTGREVFSALMAADDVYRPVFAPPGVPEERVEILRAAFAAAMEDPLLIAEAERLSRAIEWQTGEVVATTMAQVTQLSAEAADELRSIFAP